MLWLLAGWDMKHKRSHDQMIAGVCGGIAEWLGWSPKRVRIAYVLVSSLSVAFPRVAVYLRSGS